MNTCQNKPTPFKWTSLNLLFLLLTMPVVYGDSVWNQEGGGIFSDSANWDGSGSTYYFNNNATGEISFIEDVTTESVYFNNTSGELVLNLDGKHLNTRTYLVIGDEGLSPNRVTFQGDTVKVRRFTIWGANNVVLVDGTEISGDQQYFRIGAKGEGGSTLTFQNGGILSYTGGETSYIGSGTSIENQVIVDGVGSKLQFLESGIRFSIGNGGSTGNLLHITNGGEFTGPQDGETYVGFGKNSNGNLLKIEGAGSVVNTGTLWIGSSGTSSKSIDNSVHVKGGELNILTGNLNVGGETSTSSGNSLYIQGGTVQVNEALRLGEFANGNSLILNEGGILNVKGSLEAFSGTVDVNEGSLSAMSLTVGLLSSVDFQKGLISAGESHIEPTFYVGDGSGGTAVYRLSDRSGQHQFDTGLILRSNARLEGVGKIYASLQAAAGATIAGGYTDDLEKNFGKLTLTPQATQNWDNEGVTLVVGLGDLSAGEAIEGFNHDLIVFDAGYTFIAGGQVEIDLMHYKESLSGELQSAFKVISWEAFDGNVENISVSFSAHTDSITYKFQEDGLYITAIPEKATSMLVGLLLLFCVDQYRRKTTTALRNFEK